MRTGKYRDWSLTFSGAQSPEAGSRRAECSNWETWENAVEFRVRFVGPDHPAMPCMPKDRPWTICVTEVTTTLYLDVVACADLTTEQKERHLEGAWAAYRDLAASRPLEVGELI